MIADPNECFICQELIMTYLIINIIINISTQHSCIKNSRHVPLASGTCLLFVCYSYKQYLLSDELCNKEKNREMEKPGDVSLTLSQQPEPQFPQLESQGTIIEKLQIVLSICLLLHGSVVSMIKGFHIDSSYLYVTKRKRSFTSLCVSMFKNHMTISAFYHDATQMGLYGEYLHDHSF